jgi:N-hydroxyarylamine O-acetyltransferase
MPSILLPIASRLMPAYLAHIGVHDFTVPDLANLRRLQHAHLFAIPFGDLDVHYGRPIVLDFEKVLHKIVVEKREGFCYELNGALYQLLKHLGYEVRMISAGVYHKETDDYGPEFNHLALIALIDGREYLVDVGFGDLSRCPLEIGSEQVQEDGVNSFMIDTHEDGLRISKRWQGAWEHKYRFSLQGHSYDAFSAQCLNTQISPDSHFVKNKYITQPTNTGRITLFSDKLILTENGGKTERPLANGEFESLLVKYFGKRFLKA